MVSANLKGGLGNQMFQISAAISLALKNEDDFGFDFEGCFTPNQGNTSISYIDNLYRNIKRLKNYKFEKLYNEIKFSFEKIEYSNNLLIDGYFQSEKYFYEFKDIIKSIFYVEDRILPFSGFITSVHVRRGDYCKNTDFHNLLTIDYYKKAIEYIGHGNFLFFSDDIEWVKKNFISDNFLYSESKDELEDFYLMSKCNNNIIANSTFSWWSAYLNPNENKVVISPSHSNWFGIKGPKDTQDLIPNSWIQI